jgi:peptidoglycan/LPS O-acetylase OafA/YrhL
MKSSDAMKPVQLVETPAPKRVKWLDVLRLLCALEIVGFHWLRAGHNAGLFGDPDDSLSLVEAYWGDSGRGFAGLHYLLIDRADTTFPSIATNLIGLLFGFGWETVNVFILLSGLSLSFSTASLRGRLHRWYIRRASRIMVPYYIVALPIVCAAFVFCHFAALWAGSPGRLAEKVHSSTAGPWEWTILKHLVLLDPTQPQWIASFFSRAWWFVPAILVAYLFFPLFHIALRRLGTIATLLFASGLSFLSYRLVQQGTLLLNAWYFVVLNEAFSFTLGMAIGTVLRGSRGRRLIERMLETWTVIGLGLALFAMGNLANLFHATFAISSPLYTCGMAMVLGGVSKRLSRFTTLVKLARRIDIYHLYLIHQPLAFPAAVLAGLSLGSLGLVLGFPLYLLAVVAVALLLGNIFTLSLHRDKRLPRQSAVKVDEASATLRCRFPLEPEPIARSRRSG